MENTLLLPDINEILSPMHETTSTLEIDGEKISKNIKEWLIEYNSELLKNINKSKDGIFFIFVQNLLTRTSNEKWFSKILEYFEQIKFIDNINKKTINEHEFRKAGYRFPEAAPSVVFNARDVFINKYNSDWKSYFERANKNYKTDFGDDYFLLDIKYVKHKVRDLALSVFSKNYIAVDSHVIDVLRRTGLICYSYIQGIELSTDNTKHYLSIRELCLKLSEAAKISLGELDRTFWHFGKSVCSGKPKCNICPIQEKCLYFQSKQLR